MNDSSAASAASALERAEQSSRSEFMAEAAALLAGSLDYRETLDTLAHLAVPRVADWCAVDEVDEQGHVRRIAVAHPDPEKERLAWEIHERYPVDPDQPHGAPAVLRTGEAELVEEIPDELLSAAAHDAEHERIIRTLGLCSYMVVPLRARGRILGAISFVSAESERRFGADDLSFAQELADRAAHTLDNARLLRTAEEARRRTERILESITDAFFALDREWRFTYLNDEAERLLVRSRSELLGAELWAEFPDAVGSSFEEAYRRAVREQRTVEFEEFYPPLGRWFEVRAFPSEEGLSVYFRDVSDRVAVQDALRRQSTLTRTISDNATSALFMMDARGHCTYMNPAAEAMTGFSLDDVRDMPLHDAIHHHHPDGRPYPIAECPIDRALPEDFSVRAHEDVFIRRSGEFFPVVCAAAPIFDDDGVPVGTVVEVRDVTEERAAALALRESEERYRFQSETVPAQVWTARPDGALDYVSAQAAAYFGVPQETLLEEGWADVVHPDDREQAVERWKHSLGSGEPYEVEFRLRGADGGYRWHLARAVAKKAPDGRVEAWFGVNTDVEESRRAERRLEQLVVELEAERARLAELFRRAPAFIAVLRGPEHRFEMANPPYLQLVGHREVVGRTVAEALPEVVEQGFVQLLDDVLASGEPFLGSELPVELQRNPGEAAERRYVNFVYQPIREADGTTSGIFVHGVDVTDQVESRQRVEAYAAERGAVLGQIADGVMVADPQGRITFTNDAAREMLGTSAAAAMVDEYTTTYNVLTMDGAPFPPEALPLARAVEGGETVVGSRWRIRRPDGTEIVGEGSAAPVLAEDGRRLGAVLTMRDITAETRLQQALDAERARLDEVFQVAPAAIAVTRGPDHQTVSANPMYLRLVGGREVIGRTVREAIPELEGQGFFQLLDRVFTTGEPFVGDEMPARYDRNGDGVVNEALFNFVYQPLRGPEGEVQGIMTFAIDVTDQVRARQEVEAKAEELARLARALEASNRELDQFAYVASHDLKAPLRGIANLSQWIEEDVGAEAISAETRQHLELLRGRVHRMEGLIDGILQYSRAGRVREKIEPVDTGTLLEEVLELLDVPASVRVEVPERMPTVIVERLPLQQVFLNLVGNAIKYAGVERPEIRVEWSEEGSEWEFRVADNGPGIAPEYQERIFGIFQTLQARDQVEGTGIGLSLVRKIVESRGGRVWVESEEGQGATFRFRIPRDPSGGAA
jgi:PAS domain S-box-containing protein